MMIYKREGNKIYFGSYYLNSKEKKEPIEWDILEEKDGKALIISHYILDAIKFDDKSNNYENSYIRNWLNNDFYNIAFNNNEKLIIETTKVDNSIASIGFDVDPYHDTNSYVCNNTNDKIFLLSVKEAKKYFHFDEERMTKGIDYAKKQGLYYVSSTDTSFWWLRSSCLVDAYYAYCVDNDGYIDYYFNYVDRIDRGIRPACWIKL